MTDRDAFLRAIRAHPDEDTPRLAFADWLDERGDPLGEFIRVQMELHPLRDAVGDRPAESLRTRADELLRAHRAEWLGVASGVGEGYPQTAPVFVRGLPERACLSLDEVLSRGADLFAGCPTLRELAVFGVAGRGADLADCPHLAQLDTLEIADWVNDHDADHIVGSPYLTPVTHFKVWLSQRDALPRRLAALVSRHPHGTIDLIQLYGGHACGSGDEAAELNAAADTWAGRYNKLAGRPLARVVRPFDRLFPLDGDIGHGMIAGRLPDGRPALASGGFMTWVVHVFNADGRLVDETARESPVRYPGPDAYTRLNEAVARWVDEELRLEPGVIRVRELSSQDGLTISLWPNHYIGEIAAAVGRREDLGADDGRDELRGRLWSWLHGGHFEIFWDDEYWADGSGKIHTS